jgi:ABC-type dipeptide/oligopeptide/nickel transport system permease subunit
MQTSLSHKAPKQKLGFYLSASVLAVIFICGLINPLISYDPTSDVDLSRSNLAPNVDFWFGTDEQGRSVAMRLFKGISAFFFPGILAASISMLVGSVLGASSGYFGGWVSKTINALLELLDILPRMVFLILICTIFKPSIALIATVVSLLFMPSVAKVIRLKVEALASEDYILAYIAHGFHPFKIIFYHILWLQCRAALIRQGFFVFAYVLFVETALSYLGDYGVQEPTPSWGNMVAQTRSAILIWPWFFAAVAIVITIASAFSFADALARKDEETKR